ncbi:HAD-IA family hydrolase [bacterium]|nr:HAD-IA family hydrolase [bacterium]
MKIRGKSVELNVEAIVFDKDGTLIGSIETLQYIFSEYRKAANTLGYDTEKESNRLFGGSIDSVDTPLYTTYSSEVITLMAASVWLTYQFPWPKCRSIAEEINRIALQNLDLSILHKPNPGAMEAIRFFSKKIPVCIATSDSQDSVKRLLQNWEMKPLIKHVITSDEVKNGKPAPDMIERLSQDLAIPTDKILMIGDHEVDSLMAFNAKAHSISVGSKHLSSDDWVSSLQELVDLNIE